VRSINSSTSGTPFDVWCNTNIFTPLGMTNTSWRLRDLPANMLAMPYEWKNNHYVAQGQYGYPDYPDGMLHTSANQFGKYMIAYLQGGIYQGHRILQQATVDSMLSSWVPSLDPTQGAFWYSNSSLVSGRTLWGHNGGDYGISSQMWLDRTRNEGVFLLANGDAASETEYTAFQAIVTRPDVATIEDLKSRKVGTASIEFEVKEEKEPRMNTDKHR